MVELLASIVFTVAILAVAICLISTINYRLDDRYLRIRVGPIPVRKFPIEDICDLEVGHRHMSESWTNTIWMPTIRRKGVTLFRRSGRFNRVVITPDRPEQFVAEVRSHIRFIPG